ncbi:MAG: hypothetical protein P8K08_00305 [Fuerstiella sp.]|nr:hypothetical protein [Fuerstiella sp.]
MNSPIRILQSCLTLTMLVAVQPVAVAQLDFEREPINYSQTDPTDRIFQLGQRLVKGDTALAWDVDHGYLRSLLSQLNVPVSSQTLVFSKTSLQVGRISPKTPRAIYFNDDIYVGWVQHGDVIEISAADAHLGGTFYTLSQRHTDNPVPKRETSRCLQCHGSTHTRRIPGHLVRSVYPARTGQPIFRLGTHLNDHTTPFQKRWGGWYVTGTHGEQRHMGNVVLDDHDESGELDTDAGANITDLSPLVDTAPYLSGHSDIVALMVLQHQAKVHNVLTAASHSGRLTARDAVVMNRALERKVSFLSDSTRRRYESAAEKVLKALLFCDEPLLTSPVVGTSEFTQDFQQRGPFDSRGRSLRHFDLTQRLFTWPCSFLIYSESFRVLPEGVLTRVRQRLNEILGDDDPGEDFQHLSATDRRAIREILTETLPL